MTFANGTRQRPRRRNGAQARRGAMIVLVALVMVVMLAMAAISVDVAYMHLTRAQLRASTDAASRAAAESISRTQDEGVSRQVVRDLASKNPVAGVAMKFKDDDIVFGRTQRGADGRWAFSPYEQPYNSARVAGDRSSQSSTGAVPLSFGKMVGQAEFEPVITSTAAKVGVPKRDFVIVADRSHSMAFDSSGRQWKYPKGHRNGYCGVPHSTESRWSELVLAVREFVNGLEHTRDEERLGVVTYASKYNGCGGKYPDAAIDVDVTSDTSAANAFMDRRSLDPIPGATNIYAGIMEGISAISDSSRTRPDAQKIIVTMTDGKHNTGPDPRRAARVAADRDIVIIAITFSGGADKKRMQQIADITGGLYFHAPTADDLKRIFRQVADGTIGYVFVE